MTTAEPLSDGILVAIHDGAAYVHVKGRGSFKVSTGLKQFGIAAIDEGCREIVLNMAECTGMDSTFMGVLAGLASRLKQRDGGQIYIINLAARARQLLATLGLDQVVEAHMADATPDRFQWFLPADHRVKEILSGDDAGSVRADMVYQAHQNLASLSSENQLMFKDVLSFLREDLRREEGGRNVTGGG